jgi:hypothetical protein
VFGTSPGGRATAADRQNTRKIAETLDLRHCHFNKDMPYRSMPTDIDELFAAHPDLARDDVQACLVYAQAIVTSEEISPKPLKGTWSDAAR